MKYATLLGSRKHALAILSAAFILSASSVTAFADTSASVTARRNDNRRIDDYRRAEARRIEARRVEARRIEAARRADRRNGTRPVTPTVPVVVPAPVTPAPVVPVVVVTPPVVPSPPPETQPQIAGTPKTQTKATEAYSFVPTAGDADGDKLSFSIANRPVWLSFATATGALTGTPTAAQIGIYRNVTIQVAAGGEYETLPAFDIEVVSTGKQGVTLSWAPPTQNTDGSALRNLAGYKIRYGNASGVYTTTISVTNPGLATYFVDGLVPSTYYFVITSYNANGIESTVSSEAVKTI